VSRRVFCKRMKQETEGLESPPLFGKLGQEIFENTGQAAWDEWQDMQLKIVNEYRLDLTDKEARKMLSKQMRVFLGLDDDGEVLEVGTPTEG
jgi:Fe-S cluster biosynthesis and repair protein YggX